jgi:tetratricopeptide (TPR) repeat protein
MLLFLVLAGLVGMVLYSSGISAPLYLDDFIVLGNAEGYVPTRPLGYASFWLSHQLANWLGFTFPWDLTIYYRIPNVAIHILASTAVFWLARELTGRRLLAGLAGGLFLVHPIQTQAITYVTQRFEAQAALFMILSAACYVRFRKGHSNWWVLGTVLSGMAAATTKETSIALPLWLILLEVLFFSGIPRLKQLVWWLPFVAALAYPAWLAVKGAGKTITWIPFELYLLSQGKVLLKYLQLVFIPGKQYLLYDSNPATGLTLDVLAAWGLLLVLVGTALYLCRRNRVAIFGILTFFILLSPTSVVPIPDLIFEHRIYPGLCGIAIAIASLCPPRRLTVAIFSALFVLLGYRTFVRNAEWNDRIKFYEANREAFPRDVKVLASLGASYATQGEVKKALNVNLEAKKYLDTLNPFYFKEGSVIVDMNLATLYSQMGDWVHAIEESRRVLAVDHKNLVALRTLSRAYFELHEYAESRKALKRTLDSYPSDGESLIRLREVEKALGNSAEFAALDTSIKGIEAKATASMNKAVLEQQSKVAKDAPRPDLTFFFFGFLTVVLGGLAFVILVFKHHMAELVRWARTGSTISVDSPAADLQKQ